jgi:hypothetical protein
MRCFKPHLEGEGTEWVEATVELEGRLVTSLIREEFSEDGLP